MPHRKKSPIASTNQADSGAGLAYDFTLYQWPASRYTDSIYVRCTKVHRLLGLLQLKYSVADVSLPKSANESEISDKVNPLMKKIPIMKIDGGQLVEGTSKIVHELLFRTGYKGFFPSNPLEERMSWFIEHWAERWLVWMVIYGRWFKDENYLNFVKTFTAARNNSDIPLSINFVRMRAVQILKSTELGGLKPGPYLQELHAGATMLDKILAQNQFLLGPKIKECDLSIFMSLQSLHDPSLREESLLLRDFKHLMRWLQEVDAMTQTAHTRPIPSGRDCDEFIQANAKTA